MYNWLSQQVLRVARLPHEPEPPAGAVGSIRVFRAGRNYYKVRLLRWLLTLFGAAASLVFSFGMLHYLEIEVNAVRAANAQASATAAATPALVPVPAATTDTAAVTPSASEAVSASLPPTEAALTVSTPETTAAAATPVKKRRGKAQREGKEGFVRTVARFPTWVFPLLHVIEYGAFILLIAQLPFGYAAMRLNFEQHWYIVTDRSLRIRTGVFSIRESTMSFANLQQVEVKQGPIQRFLGLADVHVQSAGGGQNHGEDVADSLHTGIFHSVECATEIRDLIVERLRRYREAGLGEPDDDHTENPGGSAAHADTNAVATDDTLAAAQELLAEARALRTALS
ncbi:MAG: PH domain-containing protein [Candidatus Didemnitutus sp.]|nr:PH domain-containing protein [Candidatus Didemnitutus sp.]